MRNVSLRRLTLIKEDATRYGEEKSKMNLNRFSVGWFSAKICKYVEEHFDNLHEIINVLTDFID